MTTETLALPMSDDLWNPLFSNQPAACRVHHCWADQCPAGSHDQGDTVPLPPGYPDWYCTGCGDSGMNGDPHHCDGRGESS